MAIPTSITSWSQWTDRGGNVHRSEGILVHYFESDALFDDDLGYVWTDDLGRGSVTTAQDDAGSFLEVYAYEYPWVNGVAQVFRPGSWYGMNEWSTIAPGSGVYDVAERANYGTDLPIRDNTTYAGATYGIVQAIRYMHSYYAGVFSDELVAAGEKQFRVGKVDVLYDKSVRDTWYRASERLLSIAEHNWASWDVIMHEYGHHITAQYGISRSPGGDHTLVEDLYDAARFQNDPARAFKSTALAWDEGIATYLGLSAVKLGGISTAFTGELLPASDRDDWYHSFNASNASSVLPANEDDYLSESYSIENKKLRFRSAGGITELKVSGAGEANELSVQRVLWDLADEAGEVGGFLTNAHSDKASFGAMKVWRDVLLGPDLDNNGVGDGNHTFEEAWRDLTVVLSQDAGKAAVGLPAGATQAQAVARVGELLGEHGISALLRGPSIIPIGEPLEFRYYTTNGDNSVFHRAVVFKHDWSGVIWDSLNFALEPSADARGLTVTKNLLPGTYHLVMLNSPLIYRAAADFNGGLAATMFKYYWSGAKTFNVAAVPAPGVLGIAVLALGTRRRRAMGARG